MCPRNFNVPNALFWLECVKLPTTVCIWPAVFLNFWRDIPIQSIYIYKTNNTVNQSPVLIETLKYIKDIKAHNRHKTQANSKHLKIKIAICKVQLIRLKHTICVCCSPSPCLLAGLAVCSCLCESPLPPYFHNSWSPPPPYLVAVNNK